MKRVVRFWILVLLGLWIGLGLHDLDRDSAGSDPAISQAQEKPTAAEVWVNQGQQQYDRGQLAAAVESFGQALKILQRDNEVLQSVQVLSLSSLAHQKLGQWSIAREEIDQGLALAKERSERERRDRVQAQLLSAQGQLEFDLGNPEAALKAWQAAETLYQAVEFQPGILGSQINQIQALQVLGFYRRAAERYQSIQVALENLPDSPVKAIGLNNLGNTLRQVADLKTAQQVLHQGLEMAQRLGSPQLESQLRLSLGHGARSLAQRARIVDDTATVNQETEQAIGYYQQVIDDVAETYPLLRVQAQLSQLQLWLEPPQLSINTFKAVQEVVEDLQRSLPQLPPSRASVNAQVDFAENLLQLPQKQVQNTREPVTLNLLNNIPLQAFLEKTIDQAQQLEDLRSQSYALGTLGAVYEQKQNWQQAKQMTRSALQKSQEILAPELSYQWQWQMGRVLNSEVGSQNFSSGDATRTELGRTKAVQGSETDVETALDYYEVAYETLKGLRGDLISLNPEVQYSFREQVEPVYREYVDLLLSPDSPSQEALKKARSVIEGLQLAELDNFFQEACVTTKPQEIEAIDSKAAVFYPIILPTHLAVIVSIPDQELVYYATLQTQGRVERVLAEMLQAISPAFPRQFGQKSQSKVYEWLIEPAETTLQAAGVETLVFVLDGALRNLPMSALYDGEHYLIEKYNVALTPGLQLLPPSLVSASQIKLLAVGLTEARQGFTALPAVQPELDGITADAESRRLVNQDFTELNLEETIRQFPAPILHLATHGQFSSNPDQTFVLTWDGKIEAKDFEALLKAGDEDDEVSPIDLLVLSACQTAAGDDRAALGLAGLAVRSGARSTLATLWSVNDQSTGRLMIDFYKNLIHQHLSKVAALRNAQLALLQTEDYNHPYYWAPFVLVGNWL
jgi:CHAT domain-containing protein